jgi:mono/diheme cytochrome c family protein
MHRLTATRDQREAPYSSLLAKRPPQYQRIADPYDRKADLTARAKSYLHVNCSICHVEAGGGNAQFDAANLTPLAKMKLLDVKPMHHTFDLQDAKLIAPGEPDRSVLLHRMALRGAGQMPPLATSVVDEPAVEMLREWIASLKRLEKENK